MAEQPMIEISQNDNLERVIRICNTNFRAISANSKISTGTISDDVAREMAAMAQAFNEELDSEARIRASADDDLEDMITGLDTHFLPITGGTITGDLDIEGDAFSNQEQFYFTFKTADHTQYTPVASPCFVLDTTAMELYYYDNGVYTNITNNSTASTVTGVKGDEESTYRTGNVNLTCSDIGAATANHSHNYATGVKGNAETDYRTGNVNLTPANIGAAASSHTHNYAGSDSAGGAANSLKNFVNVNNTAQNCNTVNSNCIGYYTSNGPATSLGASTNDGALYAQRYSDAWQAQIAQDYRNGNLFVRGKNNGTWQAWKALSYSGHTHDGRYWRGTKDSNGFWQLNDPDGSTSQWIRTTSNGLIPHTSGGAGALGTSSWPFNNIYGKNIYQNGTKVSVNGHTHNYAAASHSHSYLPLSGGTLTGRVYSTSDVISVGYMDIDSGDNNTAALRLRSAKSFGGSVQNAIVFHRTWTETTYTISIASDRRLKNHIEYIDKDDSVSFIKSLNPVLYSLKSDEDNEKRLGFYAQDVGESDTWDSSIVRERESSSSGEDDLDTVFSLDYTQLHAPIVAALQDALERIEQLEARVAELEAKLNEQSEE